ncbi:MAG: hypothetical protein ACYCTB_10030 [bacterium]|jgi:regulator of sigma D
MKKKIVISFSVSEHVKMIFNKLASDKNMSKSELIERIILDYFDSKKDDLLAAAVQDNLENLDLKISKIDTVLSKNFKDSDYKIDLILDKISNFNEQKLATNVINEMKKLGA